jgi:hypothetical protein
MNFRANKPSMVRLRKAWYYCCFGFAPALAGKTIERYYAGAGTEAAPIELEQLGPSHPYLKAIGSPPLRFQEPPLPLGSMEQTPVAPPPNPATVPKPASARSGGEPPPPPVKPSALGGPKPATAPDDTVASAGQQAGHDQALPSIIPDEMRPKVRPEEFLPFFQLPGSGQHEVPAPEVPPTLPQSSATYRKE